MYRLGCSSAALAIFLCGPQASAAQAPDASAVSNAFQQAWQADLAGDPHRELQLIESGLTAVMLAGPKADGYVPGVATAAAAYHHLGHTLQAEQVYLRAQEAARNLPEVQKNLAIDHALLLEGEQRQVSSVAAWKEAVRIDEAQPQRSSLYSAELISLALEEESVGHLSEAEALYRRALGQPRADLRFWPAPALFMPGVRRVRLPIWDPRYALLTFLQWRGRLLEAGQVCREGAAQARKEHDAFYELLYTLCEAGIASREPRLQDADLSRTDWTSLAAAALAKPDRNAEARVTLANEFLEAGRGDDAIRVFRANAEQAGRLNGKGSSEYVAAVYYLAFELRRQGRYEEAQQALAAIESVVAAFPIHRDWLSTLLQERAQVQKATGNIAEATRLFKESARLQEYGPDLPEETVQRFNDIVKDLGGRWQPGIPRPVDMEILRRAMALAEQAPGRGALRLIDEVASIAQSNPEPERRMLCDWRVREAARIAGPESDAAVEALLESAFPNRPEMLERAENMVRSTRGDDSIRLEDVLLDKTMFLRSPEQFAAALAIRRQVLRLKIVVYGDDSGDVAEEYGRTAQFCDQAGHPEEARPLWLASVDTSRKRNGGYGWDHAFNADRAALAMAHRNDFAQAMAWNDEALQAVKYDPGSTQQAMNARRQILELQRKSSIQ